MRSGLHCSRQASVDEHAPKALIAYKLTPIRPVTIKTRENLLAVLLKVRSKLVKAFILQAMANADAMEVAVL
jgi:hypothetical protein